MPKTESNGSAYQTLEDKLILAVKALGRIAHDSRFMNRRQIARFARLTLDEITKKVAKRPDNMHNSAEKET